MNITIIGGNLTRDPEMRYTPAGTCLCEFTVANNKTWKTESGEERKSVIFLDCTAWGRTAEVICQYFGKGGKIILTGELKQDTWEDKQSGQKRSKIGLTVRSFEFCGANGKDAPGPDGPPRTDRRVQTASERVAAAGGPAEPGDDDVPF